MVESLHRPWHLPSLKLAQLARWEESLFAAYVTISIKKEKTRRQCKTSPHIKDKEPLWYRVP